MDRIDISIAGTKVETVSGRQFILCIDRNHLILIWYEEDGYNLESYLKSYD
jgi:hypothetical protein